MILEWFGASDNGYGDLMLPLCFAQVQGQLNDTMVYLGVRWEFDAKEKNTPADLLEAIYHKVPFPNVTLLHSFNHFYNPPIDINMYLKRTDVLHRYHTLYLPYEYKEGNYDVICTPINNKIPFTTYKEGDADWKQYMSNEEWQRLIDAPNTKHIDYNTPVDEAIDLLINCRSFIGYHGSCAWLARLVGVPMIIYSNRPSLTKYCFPWAGKTFEQSKLDLNKVRRHYRHHMLDYKKALQ